MSEGKSYRKYNSETHDSFVNSNVNMFERRGSNIVHVGSHDKYIAQGKRQNAESKYCLNCKDNSGGFCKRYNKWATNAREYCKKKKAQESKRKKTLQNAKEYVFNPDDVNYERIVLGKVSADYIKRECKDSIIIWITGSGSASDSDRATYSAVLEYNGKGKCLTGSHIGSTANQIMIEGITECIKRINSPSKVHIVCAAKLGIQRAFVGKGINASQIMEALKLLKSKGCKLVELDCEGAGTVINKYVNDAHKSVYTNLCTDDGK